MAKLLFASSAEYVHNKAGIFWDYVFTEPLIPAGLIAVVAMLIGFGIAAIVL